MKKIFVILAILVTLIAIFTVSASAATYSGNCGATSYDNVTWSLDTSTGNLTISGTGTMKDYSSYSEAPWYYYAYYINTVIIENGVTSIGDYAFCDYPWITSVTIADSVKNIGNYAFSSCRNLANVTMGNHVETIGCDAFSYTGLKSIVIPNSVKNIEFYTFGSCRELTTVIIGNGVKTIGNSAFANCEKLASITIPNSVTYLGEFAFSNCTSLSSLTLGSNVKTIDFFAFEYCSGLSNITVDPNNNTYYSSGNCIIKKSNKELVLGCKTSIIPDDVISIGNCAFNGCTELTTITIPENIIIIEDSAFLDCVGLTEIYYNAIECTTSNGYYSSVFRNAGRFGSGIKLVIGASVKKIPPYLFNSQFYYQPNVISVHFEAGSVCESIGTRAFNECTTLKTVYNPSTLTFARGSTDNGYVAYYADTVINARLRSAAPGLGADLSLTVYADISATIDTVDIPAAEVPQYVKLRVTMNGKTTDLVGTLVSGNQYSFKFKGIAPQCIGDEIDLALVYNDGEKDVIIDTIEDYSIVQYCQKLMTLTAAQLGTTQAKFDQLKTLIADLVAYSTAAQDYINYKVDANPTVSGATPSTFVPLTGGDTSKTATTVPGLNFKAATLYFYSTNVLQFDFEATDITGVTVKINGKERAFTCIDPANNLYRVETDDIYAIEFEDVYTIELLKNGEVAQTLTYSVKSYVYSKQGKTDGSGNPTAMAILAQRTWNYGQSAKAYAAK